MHPNEKLLNTFYNAFQQRDYKTMQSCYSDNTVFSDPVFPNLNATEVKGMWQMFCVKSKDMQITFSDVVANDSKGSANWQAQYTFGATGNKVTNNISAQFVFENGKIIQHSDSFNFYKWARQALGFTGLLFGWTPMVKNKMRAMAARSLNQFLGQTKNPQT
jgi:ketosteroid isomerase-like protein